MGAIKFFASFRSIFVNTAFVVLQVDAFAIFIWDYFYYFAVFYDFFCVIACFFFVECDSVIVTVLFAAGGCALLARGRLFHAVITLVSADN